MDLYYPDSRQDIMDGHQDGKDGPYNGHKDGSVFVGFGSSSG